MPARNPFDIFTRSRKAPRANAGIEANDEGGRGNSRVFPRGGEQASPRGETLRTAGSQSEDATGVSPWSFTAYPELRAVFSTRRDGSLVFAREGKRTALSHAQAQFLSAYGFGACAPCFCRQEHGARVVIARENQSGFLGNCDALVTKEAGKALMIVAADCLPIFVYDPKLKIIGLIHAGWRSLQKRIIEGFVRTASDAFGVNPAGFIVSIGPGIGACHYEVGAPVAEQFREYPDAVAERDGKLFLDLHSVAVAQLRALGVAREHIAVSSDCTFCLSEKYFSYRREGKGYGHMLAAFCHSR